MNKLLEKLRSGDLRSDGRANEVADNVLKNPRLMDELIEGLTEPDKVVRGRAAHALEMVSRIHPEFVKPLLPRLLKLSVEDEVPMVRWHLVMILGNVQLTRQQTDEVVPVLFSLLKDDSNFVKSWAISTLVILGRKNKKWREKMISEIAPLKNNSSIAIRVRATKAMQLLENEKTPIPATWKKAEQTAD